MRYTCWLTSVCFSLVNLVTGGLAQKLRGERGKLCLLSYSFLNYDPKDNCCPYLWLFLEDTICPNLPQTWVKASLDWTSAGTMDDYTAGKLFSPSNRVVVFPYGSRRWPPMGCDFRIRSLPEVPGRKVFSICWLPEDWRARCKASFLLLKREYTQQSSWNCLPL